MRMINLVNVRSLTPLFVLHFLGHFNPNVLIHSLPTLHSHYIYKHNLFVWHIKNFTNQVVILFHSDTLIPASLIHSLPTLHSHCFLFLLLAALGSAGLRLGAQALCIRANLHSGNKL